MMMMAPPRSSRAILCSLGILSSRALFARGFTPSSLRRIHLNSCLFQNAKETHNQAPPSSSVINHGLVGGDYAGLSATFSTTTGELIPVPEYLVPKVLLEWGQGPSCLEVICSENVEQPQHMSMTRTTVSVVPDVGCGVDNLDTMKSQDEIDMHQIKSFDNTIVALEYTLPNKMTRHETTFWLQQDQQRVRVMVDIQDNQVKSPVTIVLEQQTSKQSTRGTIADGGGLDGRTVSRLLGDLAKGKPFAEQSPISWEHDRHDDESMTFLNLPGNVTIAYGFQTEPAILEVGHVVDSTTRRVVRRNFDADGTLQGIQYSTEQAKL